MFFFVNHALLYWKYKKRNTVDCISSGVSTLIDCSLSHTVLDLMVLRLGAGAVPTFKSLGADLCEGKES